VPVYSYQAISKTGEELRGLIDADTGRDARQKLRAAGVFVTEVSETATAAEPTGALSLPRVPLRRGRTEKVALVTRQFATLVGAGVPLVEALSVMIQQAGDRPLQVMLMDVRERVTRGSSLADALALHPDCFNETYVCMVRAGEASGRLGAILDSLAVHSERRAALKGKVVAALIYPAILAAAGLLVVAFLVSFVVPKFAGLLDKSHRGLPLPTAVLMGVSHFIRTEWWLILLVVAGAAVLFRLLMRRESFRWRMDRLVLRLPLVGDLMRKQFIAQFCTTLATLLGSSIRVSEALLIAKGVMRNRVLTASVESLHSEIRAGRDIASTLQKGQVFPPLVSYMIAVGEKSGRLEEMLRMIADSYEREIGISLQKLVAVLEPAIVVCMAGVVAFIVAAILLPILALSQITF